jgi:uncharacterized membrane protein
MLGGWFKNGASIWSQIDNMGVTISTIDRNAPPVAVTDNYTTPINTPVTLNPLQADSDPNSDSLSVYSINDVELFPGTAQTISVPNGTVNVSTTNAITFTPNTGYTGIVTFPYLITDGNGSASQANQVINITNTSTAAPFACDNTIYLIRRQSGVTQFSTLSASAVPFVVVDKFVANNINGIGYNAINGLIYGVDSVKNKIVSIDSAGTITELISVPASAAGYPAGDISTTGVFYFATSSGAGVSQIKTYDIATNTIGTVPLSQIISFADFSFNPRNGLLYTVDNPGISSSRGLYSINPTTGTTTKIGSSLSPLFNSSTTAITATWFNSKGEFFIYDQGIGNIFKVDLTTGALTHISNSTVLSQADAASCIAAPFLEKTVSPTTIPAGGSVTYTYKITNGNPINNLIGDFEDILNNARLYNGGTLTQSNFATNGTANSYATTNTLNITGYSIAPLQTAEIRVSVKTSATTPIGTIFNQANLKNLNNQYPDTPSDYPTTPAFEDATPLIITAPVLNNAPIAVDDNYTTSGTTPITLTPQNLDSDPDNDILTVTEINGVTITPGTPQTITVPDGVVNVDATGKFTFTADANFDGTVTFPYVISDGNGGEATANEIINVTIPSDPKLELIKTSSVVDTNSDGITQAGETINYSFSVKNTGNVDITNLTITDSKCTVSGNLATLAVGATDTTTFSCSYTITQADITAGKVTNTATVTGKDPSNQDVTDISDSNDPTKTGADDPTETPLTQTPRLSLIKKSTVNGTGSAGDTISYTFEVTNTGNVPITNLTITDSKCTVSGNLATLAVGATDTTTFSCSYTITQADITAGKVTNTATVTGKDPSNQDVTDISDSNDPTKTGADDPTETPLTQTPRLSLIKKSTVNGTGSAGDTISYTFEVTNTGNVPITNLTITDSKCTVSGNLATLAVGATDTTTFSCSYTITQADITAGKVTNTATVTGKDPSNQDVTDISDSNDPTKTGADDPTETPLTQTPRLSLIKKSTVNGTGSAGDTISYTFEVTNTGNVPITNLTITDSKCTVSGTLATLAVGANDTTTFTCTYTIVQADIDSGNVSNTATVTGKDPKNNNVTDVSDSNDPTKIGNDDPTITNLPSDSKLELLKSSTLNDPNNDSKSQVGETITYNFSVKNIGVTTISNITITDNKCTVTGLLPSLAVGAIDTTTFSCTYILTAADLAAGEVSNSAKVTGKDPKGLDIEDISDSNDPTKTGDDDPTITPLGADGKVELIKTSTFNDTNSDGKTQVGETITYKFSVKNTGSVALTNITLTDTKCTVTGTLATLAIGATDSSTFSCTYTITQADIDAGNVSNTASVRAKDPKGGDVTDTSDSNDPTKPETDNPTDTPIPQSGQLELIKKSNYTGNGKVGDIINYTFDVKNTGNVTLTNITLTDTKCTITGTLAALAVGGIDSTTFSCTYTITQADIDAGNVSNTAIVSGKDPKGKDITDTSDSNDPTKPETDNPTDTPIPQSGQLELIKKSNYTGNGKVGDIINYTFDVKNTGNVTLTNITLTDTKCTITGTLATLAVGATDSTTFSCTYTITQADIDAGNVSNTATARAKDPKGGDVTDISDNNDPTKPGKDDPTETPVPQTGSLELIKKSNYHGSGVVGDVINYTFEVKNVGNVTLTNITIADNKCNIKGVLGSLAVGAIDTSAFSCSYSITQQDIDAGKVTNSAIVTGKDPKGKDVTDISDDSDPTKPGSDDATETKFPPQLIKLVRTGSDPSDPKLTLGMLLLLIGMSLKLSLKQDLV